MRALMLGLLLSGAWLGAPTRTAAYSIQEAILRVKPAVVLITTTVGGDVTLNCGRGPVTVSLAPYIETGTGWFVDGRGYVITNAHVVDPAYRLPPWVIHELKKKAIDQACVEPKLKARRLMHGERPEVEEELRQAAAGALAGAKLEAQPQITVMLSNGVKLEAKVEKFSPPPSVDSAGKPTPDSGRDVALLRVQERIYPAIGLTTREVQSGDPVHILGFPGAVLAHELSNPGVTLEPAAAAVPVGADDARRDARERRGLRQHVGPAVVEEPLPCHPDPGHRLHRARAQSGAARCPDQDRFRNEPSEASGLDPARAGGSRARAAQLRPRAEDRHLLHDPRGAAERAGGPDSPPARLQDGAHPQGRPRRLDQRAPAGRGEIGAAVDRARALQEPLARRHRAASVPAGWGN